MPHVVSTGVRDIASFRAAVCDALRKVAAEVVLAGDAEQAALAVTAAEVQLLGDRDAWRAAGNLKEGEQDQYAAGCFLLLPGGRKMVLIAPQNYGPDQDHMIVDADTGHPGWVIRNNRPLILENTDDHTSSFVRILATFRAGSAVYCPLGWKGDVLGVGVCVSQARNAMTADDLDAHVAFGHLLATAWVAHGGAGFLNRFAT